MRVTLGAELRGIRGPLTSEAEVRGDSGPLTFMAEVRGESKGFAGCQPVVSQVGRLMPTSFAGIGVRGLMRKRCGCCS